MPVSLGVSSGAVEPARADHASCEGQASPSVRGVVRAMDAEVEAIDLVEHELTRLLRRAESARTRHPAALRLDRSAYLLLGELEWRGPRGIAALAQSFQLDVSTASRQVAALEAKGLVERRADPADGRVCLLEITPH